MVTNPIAGTRKRGKTEAEDLALENELLGDEKERAEHQMLVDLSRNDVGRVAKVGTVAIPKYMVIEKYQQIHGTEVVDGTGSFEEVFERLSDSMEHGIKNLK